MSIALDNDNIGGIRRFLSEHQFFIGKLSTRITVRLYEMQETREVEYVLSHFIHTPQQADAYRPSVPYGSDEADALSSAISALTIEYRCAVNVGSEPNEGWLVPNADFLST